MKMNDARAAWARAALETFKKVTGEIDDETAIRDLMSDLCHLINQRGQDPEEEFNQAWWRYREEITELADAEYEGNRQPPV